MQFRIQPAFILAALLAVIGLLLLCNLLTIFCRFYLDHQYALGFVPLFDFGQEGNIPTLYSSVSMLLASILLYAIALTHKRLGNDYIAWLGLAIIFSFLAIDEASQIHEKLIPFMHWLLKTSKPLYFSWVIPYGLAVVLFIVSYSKFLMQLPMTTRRQFILCGALFISGAIGMELVAADYHDSHGNNMHHALLQTVEELLEMLGIALFNYVLCRYLVVNQFNSLSITTKAVTLSE